MKWLHEMIKVFIRRVFPLRIKLCYNVIIIRLKRIRIRFKRIRLRVRANEGNKEVQMRTAVCVSACGDKAIRLSALRAEQSNWVMPIFVHLILWGVCVWGAITLISCYFSTKLILRRLYRVSADNKANARIVQWYSDSKAGIARLRECENHTKLMVLPIAAAEKSVFLLKEYLDEVAMTKAADKILQCLDRFEIKEGYEDLFVDA